MKENEGKRTNVTADDCNRNFFYGVYCFNFESFEGQLQDVSTCLYARPVLVQPFSAYNVIVHIVSS